MKENRAYAPSTDLKLPPPVMIRRDCPNGIGGVRRASAAPHQAAFLLALATAAVLVAAPSAARAEEPAAKQTQLRSELTAARDAQDRWLGSGANGDAWRNWLKNNELRLQLDAAAPNVIALHEVLRLYRSDTPGIKRAQFKNVRRALERWIDALPQATAGQLAALARSHAVQAVTTDAGRSQADAAKLQTAFDQLEAYLGRSKTNGPPWRAFLASDELAAELANAPAADIMQLETVLARYKSGHAGLERQEFRNVERALTVYCRSLRAFRLDDQPAELASCLERLATHLERYERRGSVRELSEIGACLVWLEQHGLAAEVVRAVRQRYAQANLYAKITGDVLLSQFEREIDEQFPISDWSNGAYVTGTARLQGHVGFRLVPDDERIAMQMLFDGTIDSRTTGYSGPVGFSGTGLTRMNAQKSVFADADAVTSLPAAAQADTSLRFNGVWSDFRGPVMDRIATRIGWKKVLENRPSSERAVSRRAEGDLLRRVEAEAHELVSQLNETYVEMVRVPLHEKGIFPRDLRLSSTREQLCIEATQSAPEQLAATSRPPQFGGEWAASMAIHESLINNSTSTTLSGKTLESYDLAEILEQMIGSVPPGFDNVDGIPWSLTLAGSRPLEVRFADDVVTVTIRCQKVTAGPEEFCIPFAVSARYRGSIDGDTIRFDRLGDLEVVIAMVGAPPKGNDGLTDSQQEVAKRFEMIFQEELTFSASQLPFEPPAGVEFVPAELKSNDGWLLIGLDLVKDN